MGRGLHNLVNNSGQSDGTQIVEIGWIILAAKQATSPASHCGGGL